MFSTLRVGLLASLGVTQLKFYQVLLWQRTSHSGSLQRRLIDGRFSRFNGPTDRQAGTQML